MSEAKVPRLVTIYWRDIPAQVAAQKGRFREKALLGPRFQLAIDRAATVAGLTDTDSYLAEWRRVTVNCGEDMAASVAAEVARLEDTYTEDRLERLVRTGGVED